MADHDVRKRLESETERLRTISENSADSCLSAKSIALSDDAVRELLIRKLEEGNVFVGLRCTDGSTIPEQRGVLVGLACPSGTICLVDPSFLVMVVISERRVIRIVDPYDPETAGNVSLPLTPAGALPLSLAVPSGAHAVIVSQSSLLPLQARERAFLVDRGLTQGSSPQMSTTSPFSTQYMTPTTTTDPTVYATTTNSGNPPLADDSQQDASLDSHQDTQMDNQTDQGFDD
jgi:hypothetical protein